MGDPFDDLLRGVRADGTAVDRSVLTPPWALRFDEGAPLTLCVPLRGEAWVLLDGDDRPHRVGRGAAAMVRGPRPFVLTDAPASTTPPRPLREAGPADGVPTEGPGSTVLLAGAYRFQGAMPARLLDALPPVAVVTDDDCSPVSDFLESQLTRGRPGRRIVLDRLLDWLLACTLRDWFDSPGACPPGWYRAWGDAVVGPVLRAMHESPGRPWTLASLAAEAGVSRTTAAARFTDLMGEPPLSYLTQWRMDLAADLLTDPAETVAAVARRVGYADAFGFSTAFKRVRGLTPSEHRKAAS